MDFGNLQHTWTLGDHKTLGSGLTLGSMIGTWKQFERRSREIVRNPTYSLFVECHGDITGYVKNVSYDRVSEDSLHEPTYGTGQISIVDPDHTFIENARTTFRIGQKVFIFAGFNDDNIPRFSGIIRDVQLNTDSKTISLSIAEGGYRLNTSKTSGDFSAYNTPKLLVDHLASRAGIGTVIYENESGRPTTAEFGTTYLQFRTYWAMVHGASLLLGYKQHFDENGRLNLTRRTSFEPTGYAFNDSDIEYLKHNKQAEIINHKTIDYINSIRPEFTAGDGVVAGQHTRSQTHTVSKRRYGEHEDQETDELIGTWTNAGIIIDQSLDYYPFPRQIYDMKTAAIPQLQVDDQVFVNSQKQDVSGWFTILGIGEYISKGNYNDVFAIMSAEDRF